DTHVHCCDPANARYPWLDAVSEPNRLFALEMLEEERLSADVCEGILVQTSNRLEETRHMLESAVRFPWIKGIVAWLPLQDPSETARLLETEVLQQPLIRGIRHVLQDEADPAWLLQDTVMESLELIARAGFCFDFAGVNAAHLETAFKVSQKIPDLKLVLDHLNQPPASGSIDWAYWKIQLKALADNKNAYAKISGLGTALKKGDQWTPEDISPAIEFVLDCFGENRCFCGGDWPVTLEAGSYEKAWSNYRQVLLDLGDLDLQQKVLYQNAIDFYSISSDPL
ncbi:MAG: amidohydrolase family protein, partial [Chitinophagaceae bacterium]